MLSPLRNRFGIPGVISVIALVFAMFGGAYAATNEGGSGSASATASAKKKNKKAKKKKANKGVTVSQVRRISKQEARKFANSNPGAPGALGPQGPAGLPGANGNDGQNGADGKNGSNGGDGEDGISVSSEEFGEEAGPCTEGGTKFTSVSGDTYACNGSEGPEGSEGSPWTVGGTLPSGETLAGAWAFSGVQAAEGIAYASLSFNIPLASPIAVANTHFIVGADEPPSGCTGGTTEAPIADPGHLCIWSAQAPHNATFNSVFKPGSGFGVNGAGTTGAGLAFLISANNANATGTYAVTAP